jgi:hypothetical protein
LLFTTIEYVGSYTPTAREYTWETGNQRARYLERALPELRSRNLENDSEDEPWDPEHVSDAMKTLLLRIKKPTKVVIANKKTNKYYYF